MPTDEVIDERPEPTRDNVVPIRPAANDTAVAPDAGDETTIPIGDETDPVGEPHPPTEAEVSGMVDPLTDPAIDAAEQAAATAEGDAALESISQAVWICTNCGTTNDPAPADALVEKCAKCDEPSPAMKARIDAGLGKISGGVGTAAEAEQAARSQEGIPPAPAKQPLPPPKDRMLPYRGTSKSGHFDPIDALEALQEARTRVQYCEEEHDDDVKRAKQSGQRLKEAQDDFNTLFDSIYERKERAEQQPDMFQETERKAAIAKSDCPVERSTGAPCPACQSQRAKGKPADPSEPLHPAHPQHEDVAKALLIKDLNELRAQLEAKNFFVDVAELTTLNVNDLQALQRYGAQRGRIPAESAAAVLRKSHLAAEPGTDRQECKRCGIALVDRKDLDNGVTFFPALVMVGLGCEGLEEPPAPAPSDVEAAPRKPQSHAKKDGKKKADPDQERKHQATEGRKKGVTPARGKDPAVKGRVSRKKKEKKGK